MEIIKSIRSIIAYRKSLITYLMQIHKVRKEKAPLYFWWGTEKLEKMVHIVQEGIEKKWPKRASREEATKNWPPDWHDRNEGGCHDQQD